MTQKYYQNQFKPWVNEYLDHHNVTSTEKRSQIMSNAKTVLDTKGYEKAVEYVQRSIKSPELKAETNWAMITIVSGLAVFGIYAFTAR